MALLTDGLCINETYEVEAFLGEGAFAEVYRVKHRFLGRQAMKFFKAPGWSPDEVSAMLGEAVLLSKINHPNIVRVYDFNTASLMGAPSAFSRWNTLPEAVSPNTVVLSERSLCR
jgi:serine/threonine-protein kinase